MNTLWSYFWPLFAVGVVVGGIAGSIAFRRRRQAIGLSVGIAVAIAAAALWHGPIGAADRFTGQVERGARQALNYYEMNRVTAQLHHGPLTRRLILSGPVDDFQREELARLLGQLPGVSGAQWSLRGAGPPLIAEGIGVTVLGFLIGLLLAYLVELRRRYNLQWNW